VEWYGEQGGCLENTKTRHSKAEGTEDGKTEIKGNPTKRREMKRYRLPSATVVSILIYNRKYYKIRIS
jgi:hypothetical protein